MNHALRWKNTPASMSRPELDAYDTIPPDAKEVTVQRLLAVLKEPKRQHRIIYAGFRNVPLTYWFMQRVKSYLLHMSVKVDEANKNVLDFCLSTSKVNRSSVWTVVNSYVKPIPQYNDQGQSLVKKIKQGRNIVEKPITKDEYYVGSSWLSQAVYLTYNYLKTQHGCEAPMHAFVRSLNPQNEVLEGFRSAPKDIQFMDEHVEHLKIQEHFLYLIAQYQAAKQEREKDQYQNRTNPQRLLDIEKEKMHIQLFRDYARNIGTIYWNKPYMSRSSNFQRPARGAIGMVGSHGCPTAKELEAYKKALRESGRRRKKPKMEVDDQPLVDSFTADAGAPVQQRRRTRPTPRRTPQESSGAQPLMSGRMQRRLAEQIAASPQLENLSPYEMARQNRMRENSRELQRIMEMESGVEESDNFGSDGSDVGSDVESDGDQDEPSVLRRSQRISRQIPKVSLGMVGAL